MICQLCTGGVNPLPTAIATHRRRCRSARPADRAFYAAHGRWPRRVDRRSPLVAIGSSSRSRTQSCAAMKIVDSPAA